MGAWGNLFLVKDFIYSTGEYVCWDQAAGFRGVALVCVLKGSAVYMCCVCLHACVEAHWEVCWLPESEC